MADITSAWRSALDDIKRDVTGRTLWQALEAVVPIMLDDEVAVLGVPHEDSAVVGHLRATQVKRVMEMKLSDRLGKQVKVEVIVGDSVADWEALKHREQQVTQMQAREFEKATSVRARERKWEAIYEQLSRMFQAVGNKSLPQSRARYLISAVDAIVATVQEQGGELDDVGDRAVARLIERVSQYTEVPTTQIGLILLQRMGEL